MTDDPAAADVRVVQNAGDSRFEAYLGGELAAVAEYRTTEGGVAATHTETFPQYQGQGVATRLVAGMLDQLREQGLTVQPRCSYVAEYLQQHPEYADLVSADGAG